MECSDCGYVMDDDNEDDECPICGVTIEDILATGEVFDDISGEIGVEDSGVNHLQEELERVINYHRMEYDTTYAAALGVLEIIKSRLMDEI